MSGFPSLVETELERRLNEFRNAMLAKFRAVAHKHEKSVTDPGFDWDRDVNLQELDDHLQDEIYEFFEPGSDQRSEAVDVANMMFLKWTTTREENTP